MATQVLDDIWTGSPTTSAPTTLDGEVEMPELYEVIAKVGPVTSYGLAKEALVPRYMASGWVMRQAAAGYLHLNEATGRYATWCPWPRAA